MLKDTHKHHQGYLIFVNPTSDYQAALYEIRVDNKHSKVINVVIPEGIDSIEFIEFKFLNTPIFQEIFSKPVCLIMDSNWNFFCQCEFDSIKENSSSNHLRTVFLSKELVRKIFLVYQVSFKNDDNKTKIYPMYSSELDPVHDEIKAEMLQFWQ